MGVRERGGWGSGAVHDHSSEAIRANSAKSQSSPITERKIERGFKGT